MRVLFLSNFYPPASRGGYEEWCQEVAEGLHDRGHDILVLTSRNGRSKSPHPEPTWIHRDLYLEMEFASLRNSLHFFTSRKDNEKQNCTRLQRLVENFKPDFILIWGMWNLPRSLPAEAEKLMPDRVVYYMGDYWPYLPSQWQNYWQAPPRNWFTTGPKQLLKPIANHQLAKEIRPTLKLERVIFPTAFLRDEFARKGIVPRESSIIYGAIDTSFYQNNNGPSEVKTKEKLTLLYVGRLSEEKGVQTAIQALGILVEQKKFNQLRLIIVGTGEPEYKAYLNELIRQNKIESMVGFWGAQPKETIPDLYHNADIVLFTSIWPEPFGRVPVEAMASGTALIGSSVGGAAEVMQDNQNALLFTPGDPGSLAEKISQLVKAPALRQKLIETGRQTALEKFDIQRMIAEIESILEKTLVE